MKAKLVLLLFVGLFATTACTVIKQDQVGVKRRFGKLVGIHGPGTAAYNPFFSTYIKLPARTRKVSQRLDLPSKEGVIIQGNISYLYRIVADSAIHVLETMGESYETSVVTPTFRSSARDVSARYPARSMHTSDRAAIQSEIQSEMNAFLRPRGIEVQSVLLESVTLPPTLANAIEALLEAEQEAQQMEFELASARKEAQRLAVEAQGKRDATIIRAAGERDAVKTEAEGIRDAIRIRAEGTAAALRTEAEGAREAQLLVAKSLNREVLHFFGVQAAVALTHSPNAKTLVGDGVTPIFIGD